MDLHTHTDLWRVQRHLRGVGDLTFWGRGIPYQVLGIAAVATITWCGLLWLIGVQFGANTAAVWMVPPIAFAVAANRPMAEHKNLIELGRSQVMYLLQAGTYTDLNPWRKPEQIRVRGRVWTAEGSARLPFSQEHTRHGES